MKSVLENKNRNSRLLIAKIVIYGYRNISIVNGVIQIETVAEIYGAWQKNLLLIHMLDNI